MAWLEEWIERIEYREEIERIASGVQTLEADWIEGVK